MIIFAFPEYAYMANKLAKAKGYEKGGFIAARFKNNEMHITLKTDVKGKECIILGSIIPPESNLISFLLLADTLKKEGAKKVIALLPYLAYTRHDKFVPQESLATKWMGNILKQSGVDKIVSFDVHSENDRKLIPVSITSISAAQLFANVIIKKHLQNATLVAPDNGAIKWCEAVKQAAKMKSNIAHFEKHRIKSKITISNPIGDVSSEVVIIDDMIDTGQTLILACKKLKKLGVKKITIMATHGIFSGKLWLKLYALGVENIYCTDTLSYKHIPRNNKITILPVFEILKSEISKI